MPALHRRPAVARATARRFLIALAAGATCSGSALAQHMYTGAAGDNLWCNPMNWQPQSVPSGAAIIGPEITQRVRFAGNCTPTFVSLNAQGPVVFNGDVRNSLSIVASDVIIQSGSFTVGPSTPGAATFSMNGVAQWLSGIVGNQAVRVEAGATLTIDPLSGKRLRDAALTNSGTVTQNDALQLDGLSPITNGATWNFSAPVGIGRTTISNPSTFTNNGTVNISTGGSVSPATFGLPVRNTGTINALTGNLTLTELTMNGGTLTASPGRRIELTRDSDFNGNCQLSGNGAVALTTGVLRINAGDTLSTLDPAGTGGGFTLNSAGLDIETGAEFRNAGTFTWQRGDIVGRSIAGVPTGTAFRNDGTFIALANSFNIREVSLQNNGTLVVSTPLVFLRDGSINTGPAGVLEFRAGVLRRSPLSIPGIPARLNVNSATLRKSTANSASTDARVEALFSTLDIAEGEFTLSPSVSPHDLHQSLVAVAPLATLRIAGNTQLATSRFTGGGTVTVVSGGGTLTLVGTENGNDMTGTPGGGLRVENGRITGNGTLDNRGKLTFVGGQIGEALVTTTINNSGDIFVNTGPLRLQGIINNFSDSLIAFDSRMEMAAGALLENFGTVLIGDNANLGPLPGSPAPLIFNRDAAIITKREPNVAIITAPLDNHGEVFVQQGTLVLSGPIDTFIANPSPPFAPGTFSLTEGTYRVAPDAILSFGGRLVTQIRGTARLFVSGTCNDYEPTLIRDRAFTEIGTLLDTPTDIAVTDDAQISLTASGRINNCPECEIDLSGRAILSGLGAVDREVKTRDDATIAPGTSPGVLTMRSLNMSAGGNLEIELAGLAPGTQHDRIVVTHAARLGGVLRVELIGGYAPMAGAVHTIITAGSISGQLSRVVQPTGLGQNLRAYVDSTVTTVSVRISHALDFDGSGAINPDDLSDFITSYFAVPSSVNADFDGSGQLDPDDLADFITLYFS